MIFFLHKHCNSWHNSNVQFFPLKMRSNQVSPEGARLWQSNNQQGETKKYCFHFSSAVNYTYDVRELKKDNL